MLMVCTILQHSCIQMCADLRSCIRYPLIGSLNFKTPPTTVEYMRAGGIDKGTYTQEASALTFVSCSYRRISQKLIPLFVAGVQIHDSKYCLPFLFQESCIRKKRKSI
jgi:hypothetical protein